MVRNQALSAAVATVALWPWPAGAPSVCQDENGKWTHHACDFLEPIDPRQERHRAGWVRMN
jgi:hypothetical protein